MSWLTRVELLLGTSVANVDAGALGRLVTNSVAEDQDLEFKGQLYGNADKAKRDLASDVAAIANAVGGLLVIGIKADGGRASALAPVDISGGEEEARMRQIVAGLVAPVPAFSVIAVGSGDDTLKGFFLLSIPRSPLAPHAVRFDTRLGYPRREGSITRWLSESEVASAYRDRIAFATGESERLEDLRQEGEAELISRGGEKSAWLSMGVVPSLPGAMQINHASVQALRSRVTKGGGLELWDTPAMGAWASAHAGYRRAVIRLEDASNRATHGTMHLHRDGAGYVGLRVGVNRSPWSGNGQLSDDAYIPEDGLVRDVFNALRILTFHAVGVCGASGDGVLFATLTSAAPIRIVQSLRSHRESEPYVNVPVALHTIQLNAVATSPEEWSIASAMVIIDLLQSFGIAECQTVSPTGMVRPDRFEDGDERETVTRLGLPIDPDA